MNRSMLVLVAVLTITGISITHRADDGEKVRTVASWKLKEKLGGQNAKATVVEVTIEPGQAGLPHRHPGPAIVYVVEGVYELGIDDQPTKIYKAGESFHEPSGCLHRVSKNPGSKGRTRLIAVILHPDDAEQIATPESHD